jgi:hypothetical protein
MNSFRLHGVDPAAFLPLFELPDRELRRRHAMRVVASSEPGFPCRIGLQDAAIGDELLLLPHRHQLAGPYRACGPIFVRRGARPARLAAGEVPEVVERRLISLRVHDADHRMVDAMVCAGSAVAAELQRCFATATVAYVHLHNAAAGCWSCRADRA